MLYFKKRGGDVIGRRARMYFCFYLAKMEIEFLKKPFLQSCFWEPLQELSLGWPWVQDAFPPRGNKAEIHSSGEETDRQLLLGCGMHAVWSQHMVSHAWVFCSPPAFYRCGHEAHLDSHVTQIMHWVSGESRTSRSLTPILSSFHCIRWKVQVTVQMISVSVKVSMSLWGRGTWEGSILSDKEVSE